MAVFRFRAAAALDVRKQQEDAALTEAARREALRRDAEQRVASIRAERDAAAMRLAQASAAGIDAGDHAWHRNWITALGAASERAAHDAVTAAHAWDEARRAWQEARKRRLVLERLRDRALRRFRHEELRREQRVIDELAQVRFNTRALAGGNEACPPSTRSAKTPS